MADMKDMWNWPNNSSNGYMTDSANWSDDNSFGMDQRVNELITGNYKAWPNLDPVSGLSQTVDSANELFAKYKHYIDTFNESEPMSFHKLYNQPIIVATKQLIGGETITAANVDSTSATVTVSGAHEFENGMQLTISGMNGSWGDIDDADAVGTYFASDVSNASNGTFKLRVGSSSGPYLRFYDLADGTITAANVDSTSATITTSSAHNLSNGMVATISGMNGSWASIDDANYYVDNVTSNTFKLRVGSASGPYVRFYDLNDQSFTVAVTHDSPADFNCNSHGFSNGDDVTASGFDGSMSAFNGQTLYVQNKTTNDLQLSTDSAGNNIIKTYNLADGRLTATAPKKYSSNASLTFTANAGDTSTVSDGDVITFSALQGGSGNPWVDVLDGETLYVGNTSGSTFRVYSDQARTTEVAPYHLASSGMSDSGTVSTATVSGNVVITHAVAPANKNDDFVNGMRVDISNFDGTLGTTHNGSSFYVQNYNSSARTFNISTDSGGSNLVYFAPNETDVDLDTVEIKSGNTVSIKIPERVTKLPDTTDINLETVLIGPVSSGGISVPSGTFPNFDWVSTTRFAVLLNDSHVRFYDYSKASRTVTEDTSAAISTPQVDSGQGMTGIFHNPNWNTLAVCEYNFRTDLNLTDRLYVITDSGSGYTTDTVDMTSEISTFGGFPGDRSIAISDNGLTMVIGDPHYGLVGAANTGTAPGRIYVFERSSLSDNFDFANPDFTGTGSSNKRIGTNIILSGDGKVVIAGTGDNSAALLYYKNTSNTWVADTTNTLPTYNSNELIMSLGAFLNDTGTFLVAHTGTNGGPTHFLSRTANNTSWSLDTTLSDQFYGVNNGDFLLGRNGGTASILKKSGSSYTTVTNPMGSSQGIGPNTATDFQGPGVDVTVAAFVEESHTDLYYYVGLKNSANTITVLDYTLTDAQVFQELARTNSNTYYLEYVTTAASKDEYKLYTDIGLSTAASLAALDSFSAQSVTMHTDYEMEIAPAYTSSTQGTVKEVDTTGSNFIANTSFQTLSSFGTGKNTFTETYTPAGSHEIASATISDSTTGTLTEVKAADDAGQQVLVSPTAATTGSVIEVKSADDVGQIVLQTPTAATTGSVAVSTSDPFRYEIADVSIKMPGAQQYQYQDSSNATQNGAVIDSTGYFSPGEGAKTLYSSTGETSAQFTIGVNGSGYLASVTLTEEVDAEGRYADADDIVIPIQAQADEYVAPTVYAEDVFDTDDEWDSDSFNILKVWPTHIAPAGAKIVVNQPSSVTASQNGTKYVRSSGVIKHQLELAYPPMTYDDFREFEAVVEAARGQATPFYVNVKHLGPGANQDILLQRTDSDKDGGLSGSTHMRVREPISVGDKTILYEGFPSNQSNVFLRGEYIIANLGHGNGQLMQVVNDNIDSNVFGEAKIRIPYAARVGNSVGVQHYKNPSHIVVTLADDEFEYNVGTDGLYRFSCRFDFDEFK